MLRLSRNFNHIKYLVICYYRVKKFLENFISVRDGPEKVKKQDRDERTQEDYTTSTKIHSRCTRRIVFLCSFISALFLYYLGPSLTEMGFDRNYFPSFCAFSGFSKPNKRRTRLLCWRRTFVGRGTNTFCTSDKCFSAGDKRVENVLSNFIDTHTTYLEMIVTHRYSCTSENGQ